MVHIQTNLNDDRNKKLKQIVLDNDLKNKQEALDLVIDRFERD